MKKKVLIIFVILVVLIGAVIWFLKSNQSYYITDNEFLYDEAIKFIENKIREESEYKSEEDYQVFTDYEGFGIQENGTKRYAYMWIEAEEHYVKNGEVQSGSGSSMPYKFIFENNQVIDYEIPKDGSYYTPSIKKMFPSEVVNEIFKFNVDSSELDKKVKKYYGYLEIDEYNHVGDVSKILDNPGLNFDLRSQRDKIIEDEQNYGNRYMKFTNFQLYSRKPDRIIFKQGNKDGFFIFEQSDKAYEYLLIVSEDRMAYSVMQDYNLWCFTPDSIDTMNKSGDNYIIYDFDNTDLTEYDEGFQKDVIFRFNTENRLYRLVSYLAEFKEPVARENLGKNEFASNTEISGYKYMMNDGKEEYDD